MNTWKGIDRITALSNYDRRKEFRRKLGVVIEATLWIIAMGMIVALVVGFILTSP